MSQEQKRQVRTRYIYKYKAQLGIDGSKMRPVVHYNQTYAAVAIWESIMILLSLILRNTWNTMQIDYVLDFTQAPVESKCYIKIPKGIALHSDT